MSAREQTNGSTILIIDDEESMREGCRQILEGEGYRVAVAKNGKQGLHLMNELSPQVVLVDLKMPEMSGIEALSEMRHINPSIVAVVITAYGTVDSAVEAMKIGALDYLSKPFNEEALLEIVERGMTTYRQRESIAEMTGRRIRRRKKTKRGDNAKETDVLVIGGSAAGIVAAVTGKRRYPNKDFLVIRKEKKALVPCGIPYIFGTLGSSEKNLIPDTVLTNVGIELKIGRVISIDPENKTCQTEDGMEISFEKLVLAIGSTPVVPKWLEGANLENVFTVEKDKEYLDRMKAKLDECDTVITIGGGFIGVEISDELKKVGKDVTIVEILPRVLSAAFDEEIAIRAEESLKDRGVIVRADVGVKQILGDGKVRGALLDNGETLEAEAVILAMGYRPNTKLAEQSGIKLNEMGFIAVDEYMRTGTPDIFAVGDCAEKRGFSARQITSAMLASTACAEARITGENLYKLCTVKAFAGTIAIFSTAIGEVGFGVAGLTENVARNMGFDIATGAFEGIDKHPGTLANTHKVLVKLIVARDSGVLLGGEVIGGPSVGELTNLIGLAIQNKMTVNSILTTQIGTHPLLTAPPTAYPLTKAAEIAAEKVRRHDQRTELAGLLSQVRATSSSVPNKAVVAR